MKKGDSGFDDLVNQIKNTKKEISGLNKGIVDAQNKIINEINNSIAAEKKRIAASQEVVQAEEKKIAASRLSAASVEDEVKAATNLDSQMRITVANLEKERAELAIIAQERKRLQMQESINAITVGDAIDKRLSLTSAEMKHKQTINALNISLRSQVREFNATEGSTKQMQANLLNLQRVYDNLTENVRNSPFGEALRKNIENLNKKVLELESTTGRFGRNVGNYASAFNPLSFQVQQVARELPSLTISAQQFFLAISNNLPMLADEIKRASIEYKALLAQGIKGVPVWKQLIKSVASWQTALVVGITLITAYGKEIGGFFKNLFSGKNTFDATAISTKALNEAMSEGAKNAQAEIVKLKLLYSATQNASASMEDRIAAAKELKRLYPEYLGSLSNEEILAGNAANAYARMTEETMRSAKAKAAFNKIVEIEGQKIDIINSNDYKKIQESINSVERITADMNKAILGGADKGIIDSYKNAINEIEKQVSASYDRLEDKIKETTGEDVDLVGYLDGLEATMESLKKYIGVSDVMDFKASSSTMGIPKDYTDRLHKQEEDISREVEDLQNAIEQARINAMKEGSEKILAQMKLDHEKEIQEIDRQKQDYIRKIADNQKTEFKSKPENKNKKFDYASALKNAAAEAAPKFAELQNAVLEKQAQDNQKLIDQEIQGLNDYLKKYGNYQQKKLAITQEYQKKAAQTTSMNEKLSLRGEFKKAMSELDVEEFKKNLNWEQIFGDLDRVAYSTLQNLKNSLQQYIQESKTALDPTDLKNLVEAYNELDRKINELKPGEALKAAFGNYQNANADYQKAKDDLRKVESGQTVYAGLEYDPKSQKLVEVVLDLAKAEKKLTEAEQRRYEAQARLTEATHEYAAKAREGFDAAKAFTGALESFGVNIPEEISGAFKGVDQIISGLETVDFSKPFSIVTGGFKVIGGIGKVIGSLFGIGNKDAKLSKQIKRLQEYVTDLQATYEKLQKVIERQLGGTTGSQAKAQLNNLKAQRDAIDQMRIKEEEKKKTDRNAVKEYEKQIAELDDQIKYFYEDLFSQEFDATLKDWSSSIASALVSAFAAGEDAAAAFDNSVNDIIKNLVSRMIELQVIQPAMEKLRKYLFGEDGQSGAFGDGQLSVKDMEGLTSQFAALQGTVGTSKSLWNSMVKAAKDAGFDLMGEAEGKKQTGTSKGYEAMSQDTGSELNGRFTAIQSDVRGIYNNLNEHIARFKQFMISHTGIDMNISRLLTRSTELRSMAETSMIHLQYIRKNTEEAVNVIRTETNPILKRISNSLGGS
ncbi:MULTISPECIES: hypothetical protein [Alistipes]|uniref:hypothetical protein n=1 Tax=Alistipes TaxID=239759 RepID=UPI0011C38D58|nr:MULTISPECIES: hypothetical protein [Alistipes]